VLAFTGTVGLAYLVYPPFLAGARWQVGWDLRALEYAVPLAIQGLAMARRPGMEAAG
jgi:hypothetical protein